MKFHIESKNIIIYYTVTAVSKVWSPLQTEVQFLVWPVGWSEETEQKNIYISK